MADPSSFDTEASKPGVGEHTRNVYGAISYRVLPRKEALYGVQCSVFSGGDTNLL